DRRGHGRVLLCE
nr:immunoglobulin heavy chain junction region [Homo sapiens]MBN4570422.1 immunoglobulin heavy chain junction region [Homo sapiens]